ncbi:MAG: hypothetical protein ACJ79S_21860 [Gemmatimonadaceae bacterium]
MALAATLVALYPDAHQEDAGAHFLGARWAWRPGHHGMLVDVWGRPLFTALYLLPAQLGYPAAKLMTVAVCAAAAWQTWRLAEQLGLARAPLAVPFFVLQPSVLLLSLETMTEPIFALVFVSALRLHVGGRARAGMVAASLLPLARPEGFFLCALWGVWVLLDRRDPRVWWRRLPSTLWLAAGVAAWWLAALALTGDPLFIKHNWPGNWGAAPIYGRGSFWTYWQLRREIVGPVLWVPFVVGLAVALFRRRLPELTSAVLVLFLLHSVMWALGTMGSAGYPRYFVCVAPALALLTLVGWNTAAALAGPLLERLPRRGARPLALVTTGAVLVASAQRALAYVDAMPSSRDARAEADMYAWYRAHPRPVRQLAWTRAYVAILFDWDPWGGLQLAGDKPQKLAALRAAPPGTLVFWDDDAGPSHFGLTAADIEAAGFTRLHARRYRLMHRLPGPSWNVNESPRWLYGDAAREQELFLLYKE